MVRAMFYEMFVEMKHILCAVEVTMVKQRAIAVTSAEPTTSNSDRLFKIVSVAEYEALFPFPHLVRVMHFLERVFYGRFMQWDAVFRGNTL